MIALGSIAKVKAPALVGTTTSFAIFLTTLFSPYLGNGRGHGQ